MAVLAWAESYSVESKSSSLVPSRDAIVRRPESSCSKEGGASASRTAFGAWPWAIAKVEDGVLEEGERGPLRDAHDVGAACRVHGDADRVLDHGGEMQRRHMRFAKRARDAVGPRAKFVHRKRDQLHAEPRGDALDVRIGQG